MMVIVSVISDSATRYGDIKTLQSVFQRVSICGSLASHGYAIYPYVLSSRARGPVLYLEDNKAIG